MRKYNFAFTLTEILITITIIGIVAAFTVPTLITNHQNKSFLISLRKTYIELDEALTMMHTENYKKGLYQSRLSTAKGNIDATVKQFFYDYMQYKDDCSNGNEPCFANKYSSISSATTEDFSCTDGYAVRLRNKAGICIIPSDGTNPAKVYIDVNGDEKPNIGGRDMFTFSIYDDYNIDVVSPEEVVYGTATSSRETLFENCTSSATGEGCLGGLLENNWNLQY